MFDDLDPTQAFGACRYAAERLPRRLRTHRDARIIRRDARQLEQIVLAMFTVIATLNDRTHASLRQAYQSALAEFARQLDVRWDDDQFARLAQTDAEPDVLFRRLRRRIRSLEFCICALAVRQLLRSDEKAETTLRGTLLVAAFTLASGVNFGMLLGWAARHLLAVYKTRAKVQGRLRDMGKDVELGKIGVFVVEICNNLAFAHFQAGQIRVLAARVRRAAERLSARAPKSNYLKVVLAVTEQVAPARTTTEGE